MVPQALGVVHGPGELPPRQLRAPRARGRHARLHRRAGRVQGLVEGLHTEYIYSKGVYTQ